jgi:hypothetical protein
MESVVKFFKQGGKWYADIPNHTLEENEMVMGSDIALDYLSKGDTELFVTLTDVNPGWNVPLELKRMVHDDEGAYYAISGLLFMDFMTTHPEESADMTPQGKIRPEVWICNVTHDVFGEHPENIYITKIETRR